jgi:ATP-dependent protease ClpP protease subunit
LKGKSKVKNIEAHDYDDFDLSVSDTLPVFCNVKQVRKYRIFIDELITEPSRYRSIVNVLDNAEDTDIVEFRLNTPGGNVLAMLSIINAIKNTEATTVALIEGQVASAGTFIMLACDRIVVTYNSLVMCHPANYGAWGSQQHVKNQVEAQDKWLRKITYDVYEHFMTTEEIDDMIENSKEIWMDENEIVRRLKIRQEKLNEESSEDEEDYGDDIGDITFEGVSEPKPAPKPRKLARKAAKKDSNSK